VSDTAGRRLDGALDPPRQGCGREVIGAVAALRPRAVIMVSCDPATLARDVALLVERGYAARRAVVVDMFPHSWRVESVTLCERTDAEHGPSCRRDGQGPSASVRAGKSAGGSMQSDPAVRRGQTHPGQPRWKPSNGAARRRDARERPRG